MPTSDPAEILLTHDRWATHRLIEACAALSDEQFHQRFEMGCGSLHDTISHMLRALQGWGHLLAGRDTEAVFDKKYRTPSELADLLDEIADDFAASVKAHAHDEQLTGERGGRPYAFTRGGVLTHVMTHGMHHRAQCLNMLRHLGVKTLPPSSVVEWMLTVDAA